MVAVARKELVDAATGTPVSPRQADTSAIQSGRWITRIKPHKQAPIVTVEVDREELGAELAEVDLPRAELVARAKAELDKARAKTRATKSRKKRAAISKTFRSAGIAAKEVLDANEPFFSAVSQTNLDPLDVVRDWMDAIEVRRGKGWRKLSRTKKGAAILDAFARGTKNPWRDLLTWLFSQARSKRWEDVDWTLLEELERRLRAAPGAEQVEIPAVNWRPPGAQVPELALAQLSDREAAVVAAEINGKRLDELAGLLRAAFRKAKKCLRAGDRKVAARRIEIVEQLAATPERAARSVLCVPEGTTRLCGFPVLENELERLRAACERGYRADWPISAAVRALAAEDPEFDQYPEATQAKAEALSGTPRTTNASAGRPLKRAPVRLAGESAAHLGSVLEIETTKRRYKWAKGKARLLWFPKARALVWFQGKTTRGRTRAPEDARASDAFARWSGREATRERTIRVPEIKGSWAKLGSARRIDYASDKWGRNDEYTHDTKATLYRYGRDRPPWIWVLKGPRLTLTTRGLVG